MFYATNTAVLLDTLALRMCSYFSCPLWLQFNDKKEWTFYCPCCCVSQVSWSQVCQRYPLHVHCYLQWSGPKFTNDLVTVLRQFLYSRQSY